MSPKLGSLSAGGAIIECRYSVAAISSCNIDDAQLWFDADIKRALTGMQIVQYLACEGDR